MKVKIENHHSGHGAQFAVAMQPESEEDKQAMKTLVEILRPMVQGEFAGMSTLYAYGIEISLNGCKLEFAESGKKLAKVDFIWNSQRKDEKFVVIVLEGENELKS